MLPTQNLHPYLLIPSELCVVPKPVRFYTVSDFLFGFGGGGEEEVKSKYLMRGGGVKCNPKWPSSPDPIAKKRRKRLLSGHFWKKVEEVPDRIFLLSLLSRG